MKCAFDFRTYIAHCNMQFEQHFWHVGGRYMGGVDLIDIYIYSIPMKNPEIIYILNQKPETYKSKISPSPRRVKSK